jgi:uncharacterized integral membrane protein
VSVIRTLFYIVVGAALATVIYSNYGQRVVVYFDFTQRWHTREMPLALALFGAMILGFLVAALVGLADQMRLRGRIRQMRRASEKLESELAALRNLPLGESLPERGESKDPSRSPQG